VRHAAIPPRRRRSIAPVTSRASRVAAAPLVSARLRDRLLHLQRPLRRQHHHLLRRRFRVALQANHAAILTPRQRRLVRMASNASNVVAAVRVSVQRLAQHHQVRHQVPHHHLHRVDRRQAIHWGSAHCQHGRTISSSSLAIGELHAHNQLGRMLLVGVRAKWRR